MSFGAEGWRELAADIRKRAECPLRHGEGHPSCGWAIGNLLLDIARRVDEVGERMRAEWEAKTLREIAVSREEDRAEWKERLDKAAALEGVVERITTWCHEEGCESCVADRERMVKEAIEEPPRNANRFESWEDALRWYEHAVSPNWTKDWTAKDWMEFSKWLFATRWNWREGMPEGMP